ncbi:glycosyltransferase family 4 protein [Kaistella jeonii]|uniref:glycosyltransferase family 4 protein n=1 Tax=Kaistella jeonii TaxID=266749 RepID=UPI002938D801|nr:glycosyltransferase family 4 protein [Kaistella jeonii]
MNQFYEVTAISGEGRDLEEVEQRENVKVHALEMAREISPFTDLVSLYRLYRYFRKEKPDIVHSITPKAGLLSMIAARLAGVPVRMHTFTGLIFPSKKGFFKIVLIWMDRLLAGCATNVYPEGIGVKQDLLQYHITRKLLKIIANGNVNGINTTYFNCNQISENLQKDLRISLGISENDFVFIFVGRLVKDKGINELVSAFKNVVSTPLNDRSQHSTSNIQYSTSSIQHSTTKQLQPKLLLVGPLEQHLDPLNPETLKEIETNPHILSVGFQQEVRPYFAISDALVFPSYREGFPNVVLQSLAMNIPAIVTDINGCNEIVQHERNGLIVPPKDSHSLQIAMEELLNDPALYQTLKSKAQESILPYEQKAVWEAILEEYREVEKERV